MRYTILERDHLRHYQARFIGVDGLKHSFIQFETLDDLKPGEVVIDWTGAKMIILYEI